MAVTVPLPLPGQPVRRLMVYGVRAALDPRGAARLERLIRSHRFTDGAEFVAAGHADQQHRLGADEWSRRTPPGPPDLDGAGALDPGANAAVTAAALGLDPDLLATLPNGRDGEQARAAAFNTALWTTTWGDAIEHLTPGGRANGDQRLDNPSLDAVRDHWIDHVRGRGPLPALRLGRQPYGLLPIVATDASWRPLRGGFVEDALVPFIDQQSAGCGTTRSGRGDVINTAARRRAAGDPRHRRRAARPARAHRALPRPVLPDGAR